jgi:lipopolysaccharide biosynthesis regulator YciM
VSRSPQLRTVAKYRLGQVYEQTGDTERAIRAYRTFLRRTETADAMLEPARRQAREALERLGG